LLLIVGNARYLVLPRGAQQLKLFSDDGTFLTAIGRRGEGPGEFVAAVRAQMSDSLILVTDVGRGTMVVFAADGTYRREHRYTFDGEFVLLDPFRAVAAAWSAGPDRVAYPLHNLDLRTGETVPLGTGVERYAPGRYDDLMLRRSGNPAQAATVWLARLGELRFERWNAGSRRLEATVAGDLSWFPPATEAFDGREPPSTILVDFVVDRLDRLWVLTRVADRRWATGVIPASGRGGRMQVVDPLLIWDSRLDVFEMATGTHVTGPIFDDGLGVGLALTPSGDALLYSHVVDLRIQTERLSIQRLSVLGF
jgi:hypothetical protein